MIRLVCVLRRREGLSHEEFVAHWRDRHGPLIAATTGVARHIRRYEQHDAVSAPSIGLDPDGDGFDGVAIQWFDDVGDFVAMMREPEYALTIAPDEERFVDRSRLVWLLVDSPRTVIGDGQ